VRILVVYDLDGTLIPQSLSRRLFEEAFIQTVSQLKEEGLNVPIPNYSYQTLRYLLAASPKFNRYFRENYKSKLEKRKPEIEREGIIAQRIVYEINRRIASSFDQVQTIVLTANPMAYELIEAMGLKVDEVKIVDGSNDYVREKAKILEKLRSMGEVHYIGDSPEDEEAAKLAEANFINVNKALRSMLPYLFSI
jgi:phosphoglycolate phosphatase-like HAD superfamily hydrolase